jgi:hypothetical protein
MLQPSHRSLWHNEVLLDGQWSINEDAQGEYIERS